MTKKHYTLLAFVAVLTLFFIVSPFAERVFFESKNRGFVISLDTDDVYNAFDTGTLPEVLKLYKESGAKIAVISERNSQFNEEYIQISKNADFEIALLIYGGISKEPDFFKKLNNIVSENNVKYLLLKDLENPKKSSEKAAFSPKLLSDIISKHNLTLVLCESITQLSNEKPFGYDEYINAAAGRIVRLYETQNKSVLKDKSYDLTYFQMLNSAIDRNCKFVLVNQLADGGTSPIQEAERTCRSIKLFKERMENEGFKENINFNLSEYNQSHKTTSAASGAIIVIMLYLVFAIWFKKDLYITGIITSLSVFAITLFLPEKLLPLYATAFATVSPIFIFSTCYETAKKSYIKCFAVTTCAICFCGMVLSSLLSGSAYHLNSMLFRGVKMALIFPVVFAFILMLYTTGKEHFINAAKNIKWWHVVILLLLLVCGFIYIRRSGNASISDFENIMRNNICKVFAVRPRTKEFLIGWPCFLLFLYCTKEKKSPFFKMIFALGTSVLFSSIINSFCHVFTNAVTIYIRTFNGFIMSLPLLILILLLTKKAKD